MKLLQFWNWYISDCIYAVLVYESWRAILLKQVEKWQITESVGDGDGDGDDSWALPLRPQKNYSISCGSGILTVSDFLDGIIGLLYVYCLQVQFRCTWSPAQIFDSCAGWIRSLSWDIDRAQRLNYLNCFL